MKLSKCCFFLFLSLIFVNGERKRNKKAAMEFADSFPVLNEFSEYTTISPEILLGHQKKFSRSISGVENDEHLDTMTISFQLYGQQIYLDLKHNNDFLPTTHFVHLQDSSKPTGYTSRNFTKTEMKRCHFNGSIRYKPASQVVLSTCGDSISGVIFDNNETYFIHAGDARSLKDKHFIFRQRDKLKTNGTCSQELAKNCHIHEENRFWKPRLKRSVNSDRELFQEPYNANEDSSYLELAIVVDNKMFNFNERNVEKIHYLCQELTHIISSIYAPLNIFVVLVHVEIWTTHDEFVISRDAKDTLQKFLNYRKNTLLPKFPNDHAQLLTKIKFDGSVVGQAHLDVVCSTEYSGAVCFDDSRVTVLVAATMAHELGHNFGLDHDVDGCVCPTRSCIMSTTQSDTVALQWSSCSLERFKLTLKQKMNYCMRNKPKINKATVVPFCGNGIVERGEQCDCGTPETCTISCCNPKTCQLRTMAKCATGKCCDLETCNLKSAGFMCRAAHNECDLPEFCNGETESCPRDTFKQELQPCDENLAFCYHGQCESHRRGCQFLWGEEARSDVLDCYTRYNTRGEWFGSCGLSSDNITYKPCENGDELCGTLQCQNGTSEPLVGSTHVRKYFGRGNFAYKDREIFLCKEASFIFSVGNNPGLVANGAKCGENKMCLNQKCVSLDKLRSEGVGKSCSSNCSGNGVCNNFGNCHCDIGFGGETCQLLGAGGSIDSGPATNNKFDAALRRFVLIIAILILCLIALVFLICFCQKLFSNQASTNRKLTTATQQNFEVTIDSAISHPKLEDAHLISKSDESLINNATTSLNRVKLKSNYSIRVTDLSQKNLPTTTLNTTPKILNLSQRSLREFNEHSPKFAKNNAQRNAAFTTGSSDQIYYITSPQLQTTTNQCISNLTDTESNIYENVQKRS